MRNSEQARAAPRVVHAGPGPAGRDPEPVAAGLILRLGDG
jgi:hypothetical protein